MVGIVENETPLIVKLVGSPGWLTVSWIASGANPANDTLSNCVERPDALIVSGAF